MLERDQGEDPCVDALRDRSVYLSRRAIVGDGVERSRNGRSEVIRMAWGHVGGYVSPSYDGAEVDAIRM